MKLVIEGRCLVQDQVTGVQRYARALVEALSEMEPDCRVLRPRGKHRLLQHAWVHGVLPWQARHAEALFCPGNVAPVLLKRNVKLTVTLHCLRFLRYPESYHPSFRNYYRVLMPRVLRRADAVITVSKAAADEIEAEYSQARGKTSFAHLAAAPEFRPLAEEPGGDPPAILFVGSLAPAKNLRLLLDAFRSLLDVIPHELWIVGAPSSVLKSTEGILQNQDDSRGRIRCLGHVSDAAELASYYRRARFLVFPSLYESFGLPALEAISCGTPALVSDLPCHREVLAEAGQYFDPLDADSLRDSILDIAQDSEKRERISRSGLARAGQFSWQQCAEETRAVMARTIDP